MKRAFLILLVLFSLEARAQEIAARYVGEEDRFFTHPDPSSPVWGGIPETSLLLFPQNITTPSLLAPTVEGLKVKAVHNGKWLALRLEWKDPAPDQTLETDRMSDACAVQFPVKELSKTSPFMGSKDFPVEIIHWKGIWQADVEKGFQQVTDLYPNTWVDTHRFGNNVARDVGNPLADFARKVPVEELMAEGFGTLTHQSRSDSSGWGKWENGRWAVVLTHQLRTKDKGDPQFKLGDKTSVAFAVWEGGKGNVGARKNYAPWTGFSLEEKNESSGQ